jgi:4'-phosphopantetheinyl transferase EntD
MTPPGLASALETAFISLFPAGVAVAVERITPDNPSPLWPAEAAAILGAVPQRLAEFTAGRTAARRTLAALGHPPAALPMASDRAAIWPEGIAGSITHAAGFAVAVARRGLPLGIDLEEDAPLDPDLWPILCSPEELARLDGAETGWLVRQIFAAKEAVYKSQDPHSRAIFGHHAVEVTLSAEGFDARFRTDAGSFRAGQILQGRLARFDGLVIAGVAR